jgi:hypothetical protein
MLKKSMMRRYLLTIAAAALAAGGTMIGGRAEAAPPGAPGAIRIAVDDLNLTQNVGYYWGGHQHCWYDDGWHGPGWYWCGYAWRRGSGWGGGSGWHGWARGRGGRGMGGRGGERRGAGGRGGERGRGGTGGGGGERSDIQLKHDIVPLARLDNGIGIYRFQYNGNDHTTYVGVMAQEVAKIVPSAVSRGHDGYLRVNYDQIGVKFMTWDAWKTQTDARSRLAQ